MTSSDGAVGDPAARGGPCGAGSWRRSVSTIAWAVVGAATMIASSALIRWYEMPAWVKVVTALAPVVPLVVMFWMIVRGARHLDEMWSRVQAEALGWTVVLTAVGCMVWGQLQKAGVAEPADLSVVWALMAFVYGACFVIAKRRYD